MALGALVVSYMLELNQMGPAEQSRTLLRNLWARALCTVQFRQSDFKALCLKPCPSKVIGSGLRNRLAKIGVERWNDVARLEGSAGYLMQKHIL